MRGSKRRTNTKPTGGGSPCVKKPHYNAPIQHKREEFAPHSNLPKDVTDQVGAPVFRCERTNEMNE